jgi:hypothetical protein
VPREQDYRQIVGPVSEADYRCIKAIAEQSGFSMGHIIRRAVLVVPKNALLPTYQPCSHCVGGQEQAIETALASGSY